MGAWIEIMGYSVEETTAVVAPLVGAWIEIVAAGKHTIMALSLLSWERGLKYQDSKELSSAQTVAPLVGAWIEMH